MVFNKASNGTVTLESAGWEGGRLLPGSGSDKVLYVVKDHLGSVRVVKDGSGNIRQRFDYYPYGTASYAWTNSNATDNSEKRYRFGGKEIAGSSLIDLAGYGGAPGAPYLDFGARLYSPRTATWMSPDPLMEKYYGVSPFVYCDENPINFIDPKGKDWFQNTRTGELYFNPSYTESDLGHGYMEGDLYWMFLAKNEGFSVADNILINDNAISLPDGGYSFDREAGQKAMTKVGYALRPLEELVEVTMRTEFFSEGQLEINIPHENVRVIRTDRVAYLPKEYYQSFSREQIGATKHDINMVFPLRETIDKWEEKRSYSYSPKKNKASSLLGSFFIELLKGLPSFF